MAPKYTLKRDAHGRLKPASQAAKKAAKKATKNARRSPMKACKQNSVVTAAQYDGREWECCGQGKGKARKLVCHPVTEALRKRRATGAAAVAKRKLALERKARVKAAGGDEDYYDDWGDDSSAMELAQRQREAEMKARAENDPKAQSDRAAAYYAQTRGLSKRRKARKARKARRRR